MGNDIFGKIEAPDVIQNSYGILGGGGGGLVGFISNVIVLLTVIGGIYSLFNVILAGFAAITADGDSKKLGEMSNKITQTFIGLFVMIAAPLIAGIMGLFFFGDASFFLTPQVFGPGTL